jgi:hypothetical protein
MFWYWTTWQLTYGCTKFLCIVPVYKSTLLWCWTCLCKLVCMPKVMYTSDVPVNLIVQDYLSSRLLVVGFGWPEGEPAAASWPLAGCDGLPVCVCVILKLRPKPNTAPGRPCPKEKLLFYSSLLAFFVWPYTSKHHTSLCKLMCTAAPTVLLLAWPASLQLNFGTTTTSFADTPPHHLFTVYADHFNAALAWCRFSAKTPNPRSYCQKIKELFWLHTSWKVNFPMIWPSQITTSSPVRN